MTSLKNHSMGTAEQCSSSEHKDGLSLEMQLSIEHWDTTATFLKAWIILNLLKWVFTSLAAREEVQFILVIVTKSLIAWLQSFC